MRVVGLVAALLLGFALNTVSYWWGWESLVFFALYGALFAAGGYTYRTLKS